MEITDLQVGDVVVTGDSYGYALVRVIQGPEEKTGDPNYSKGFIEVKVVGVAKAYDTICSLGGVPGIYQAKFYTLQEYLDLYPTQHFMRAIKKLGLTHLDKS